MAVTSGIAGGHGGRSVDLTQTATITRAVAQVSDVSERGAAAAAQPIVAVLA